MLCCEIFQGCRNSNCDLPGALQMETVCSVEMSVSTYETTGCYDPVCLCMFIFRHQNAGKKEGERKTSILERGEGRQLHQLLTDLVQHKIQRKMKNVYKNCYEKNLEETSWKAYELLEDNIKIGDKV